MPPRSLLAAATAVLAFALPLPAAHASLLDLASCPSQPEEHPFTPWLDPAPYVLVPDGGLEAGGEGWTLSGATVVTGNEPFKVRAATDTRALSLPSGASATTPATCLREDRPTMRFFARRTALSPLSLLKVEVLLGDTALPIGVVAGDGSWAPTLPVPVLANLVASVDGGVPAAFRFTATGGSWRIDDVYVDPYVRH
jgi:hypothetical protein